jgi:hypothetical protein
MKLNLVEDELRSILQEDVKAIPVH